MVTFMIMEVGVCASTKAIAYKMDPRNMLNWAEIYSTKGAKF